MDNLPTVICLMGPTASGKTDLAVYLVENFNCEIVSVDSALIYKGMDIGTAKPDANILRIAPHRLIDICDPAESYSAARFRSDALCAIEEIISKGKTPLLVGGTMLYFKSLFEGIAELPEADSVVRAQIMQDAEHFGWPEMHARLSAFDPASANRISPNDSQRLQRALEIYYVSGISMTEFHRRQKEASEQCNNKNFPYNAISISIYPKERKTLHDRIALRFHQMLEQGFVQEVELLYSRGDLSADMPSMKAVGYRQVWAYLEGAMEYDDMVDRGIIATRQLAKRQLTWLRGWSNIHHFETDAPNYSKAILKFLKAAPI